MRVISKSNDYYDTAIGVGGIDKSTVYERHMSEVLYEKRLSPYENFKPNYFNWHLREFSFRWGSLFFCGKEYPYVKVNHEYDWEKDTYLIEDIYWIGKDTQRFYDDIVNEKILGKNFNKKRKHTVKEIGNIYNQMKSFEQKTNHDIHIDINCPVIKVTSNRKETLIVKNPRLITLKFYRIFDASQAHQEIEMYLNSVLCNNKEVNPEPLSEKVSLQKHGMDKWSFKKKSGKKK